MNYAVTSGKANYPTRTEPLRHYCKNHLNFISTITHPESLYGRSVSVPVIFNARAETVEEKKTFRQSLFTNRCVVPSTGFYEWDEQKKKHLFRLPGEQTLYMAGICKEYDGIQRYVILTTAANNSMKAIHDRMPVILPKDKILLWATDTAAALDYLHNEMPELVHTS